MLENKRCRRLSNIEKNLENVKQTCKHGKKFGCFKINLKSDKIMIFQINNKYNIKILQKLTNFTC